MDAYTGTFDATAMAPSCPQQDITLPIPSVLVQEAVDALLNTIYGVVFPDSEDCECFLTTVSNAENMGLDIGMTHTVIGLYINVIKPSNATNESALPVAVVSTASLSTANRY